jgi:hypothetical protein
MAEKLSKSVFPFIGSSYESRSRSFDGARTINLYPELHSYGPAGKNGEVAALFSVSGTRLVQTLGLGPIRGAYTLSNSQLSFIVSGNEVYQLAGAEGTPVAVSGNLNTSFGPVQMVDNGLQLLLVDGVNGYTIDLTAAPALTTITDEHFYNGSKTCTYLGGYFICEEAGTSNFFISDPDSSPVTWPALNTSSVDSSPDILISVISNNQQLYLLGSRTTEVWALDGGSAASPFTPISGRAINIGCTAPASVQRLAGTFLWLGANDQGDGVIYSMENDSPTRVSTHAIEYRLQQLGDLSTSVGLAWQENGHQFYGINCPGTDTTFVYDMTTKQWCERQSLVAGVMGRFIGQTHCFLNGEHIIGDHRNGNLYVLDTDHYYDWEEPLRRVRVTPHSSSGVQMMFYKTLQVDMQAGAGTLTTDPRYVLEISRDGGYTWGNPIYASGGLIGRYLNRCRWQRLGRGRDLVFRVSCDDPVNVVFLNAFLDVEEGTN